MDSVKENLVLESAKRIWSGIAVVVFILTTTAFLTSDLSTWTQFAQAQVKPYGTGEAFLGALAPAYSYCGLIVLLLMAGSYFFGISRNGTNGVTEKVVLFNRIILGIWTIQGLVGVGLISLAIRGSGEPDVPDGIWMFFTAVCFFLYVCAYYATEHTILEDNKHLKGSWGLRSLHAALQPFAVTLIFAIARHSLFYIAFFGANLILAVMFFKVQRIFLYQSFPQYQPAEKKAQA